MCQVRWWLSDSRATASLITGPTGNILINKTHSERPDIALDASRYPSSNDDPLYHSVITKPPSATVRRVAPNCLLRLLEIIPRLENVFILVIMVIGHGGDGLEVYKTISPVFVLSNEYWWAR